MRENSPTKPCPACRETILSHTRECKHCGEYLVESLKKTNALPPYKWTEGRVILLLIGLLGLGLLFYSEALMALPTLLGW